MAFLNMTSAAVFAAAETAAHGSPGLPQMATHTYVGQLFWLAVTFVALYVLLSVLVIPKLTRTIETRRAKIGGDIAAAANLKGQAEDALKAYEKALADARGRARTLGDETRNRVKAETETRRAAAEAKLTADINAAETRIAALKADVMSNVRAVASETAADIVTRLGGDAISAQDVTSAVDAALAR